MLRQITHKALLGMSAKITRLVLNFITALVLGRFYGSGFMGIYFIFVSLVTILTVPINMGMQTGLIKAVGLAEIRGDRGQIKSYLNFATCFSLLLWLFLAALLIILQKPITCKLFHLKISSELWIVAILIAILLAAIFEHYRGFFLALDKVGTAVLAELVIRPLTICLLFLLAAGFNLTIPWLIPAILIVSVGLGLLYLYIKMVNFLPDSHAKLSWNKQRDFLKLSLPLCLNDIVYLLMLWSDSLFIGYFHDASTVGIYNAASRLAAFLPFLMVSFNFTLASRITNMYHTGKASEMFGLVRKIARWNLIFALAVYGAFIIFRLEIVTLFGANFSPAQLPLLILGGSQIFHIASGPNSQILTMTGYERPVLKVSLISSIINIALNLILIPKMALIGAAIATGVSMILHNFLLLKLCRERFQESPLAENMLKLIISFIGTALLMAWISCWVNNYILLGLYILSTIILLKIWIDKTELELLYQTMTSVVKSSCFKS